MALATQCPHCRTTFRVVQDQLKLRAGIVRCGACKQIFNGIEHLVRAADIQHAPTAPTHAAAPQVPSTPHPAPDQLPPSPEIVHKDPPAVAMSPAIPDPLFDAPVDRESTTPYPENDPLCRMTLMDFTDHERHAEETSAEGTAPGSPAPEENPDAPDEVAHAIEELQKKPWRSRKKFSFFKGTDSAHISEAEEPSFVKQGRKRQRIVRSLHITLWVASFILLTGLLAQIAYTFRNQIAASLPQTKPALTAACTLVGCQVGFPAQIELISIESNELQMLVPDKNIFALTVLLRNRSATVEAWSNIGLTLNDENEKAVARRVFAPREYLQSEPVLQKGFASRSEQPVKLTFELSQLKASGYHLDLFYP